LLQKGHLKVTDKRKSTYKILVSAWFSMWGRLGLNLGVTDDESGASGDGGEADGGAAAAGQAQGEGVGGGDLDLADGQ